ncbi:MAG: GTP-binding protein Era [Bacteroidetes bacterium]|nr:MAG: GTP-binding protein Era [Bacteroidota bacterium]
MTHKSGYVNIIGNPNVGKSTLMNVLVGEKLSIITSKAQTTRHRILGIVNHDEYQIIFSDTPGIIHNPAYKMHEVMNSHIRTAMIDADLILYVVDVTERVSHEENISKLRETSLPLFVVLNKIDLSNQEDVMAMIVNWKEMLPLAQVFPIAAAHNFNTEGLLDRILEILPESPPYFPKDELTDKSMRFFVSEIIREKILLHYKQEIPYSVEVSVDAYEESEKLIKIQAHIYASRESQKAILIGKQGSAIKRVGTEARLDMEAFIGKKVFLELSVKVVKDWRDNENLLKRFGYEAN